MHPARLKREFLIHVRPNPLTYFIRYRVEYSSEHKYEFIWMSAYECDIWVNWKLNFWIWLLSYTIRWSLGPAKSYQFDTFVIVLDTSSKQHMDGESLFMLWFIQTDITTSSFVSYMLDINCTVSQYVVPFITLHLHCISFSCFNTELCFVVCSLVYIAGSPTNALRMQCH